MARQIVRPIGEWIGLLVSTVIVATAFGSALVGWTAAALILAFVGFVGLFEEVAKRVFYDGAPRAET